MKILIVDDSALHRFFLREVFAKDARFEIISEEIDGLSGVEAAKRLNPDLILMDIDMPIMDGITASREIMATHPCPIVIFSSSVDSKNSYLAYQAGVIDVIEKPNIDKFNDEDYVTNFYEKLYLIGKNVVKPEKILSDINPIIHLPKVEKKPEVIVVGASTGGPLAIRDIISELPSDFNIPLVIVQHIENGFDIGFTKWLSNSTKLKVILVNERERILPSHIYIAPATKHLVFSDGYIVTSDSSKVLNQKPSVNVLFESAAKNYKNRVVGVLLTGMGRDGGDGCKKILESGGKTVVQDKESSVIYGMPKEAIEMNVATIIAPLSRISSILGAL